VQHANLKYLPEIFVIETSQNLPRNPIKIIWNQEQKKPLEYKEQESLDGYKNK